MRQQEYFKHKDCSPQETVFNIRQILHKAGLFPVMEWLDKPYANVFSSRVTLYPSAYGTNGKGTDKFFCSASALAELMERLQNNFLSTDQFFHPTFYKTYGFFDAPDEKPISLETLADGDNTIMEPMIEHFGMKRRKVKMDMLHKWKAAMYSSMPGDAIPCVPYANLTKNRIEYTPYRLVLAVYASNGMAAGNTMAEALVQGFAEIFERYVWFELIKGKARPPRVPEEYLRQFGIYELLEELREGGAYDIAVYDGSLGKDYPVVISLLCDRQTGKMAVRCGSHPDFAVAVERTLTEAMQGKERLGAALGTARFGSAEDANFFHNAMSIFQNGTGIYPAETFIGQPDWEWKPWTGWEGPDNESFLKRMLFLVESQGYDILVRDVSHLGFPACQIVIPGMSMVCPATPLYARALYTGMSIYDGGARFPRLTEKEEESFLKLIRFREGSLKESHLDALLLRPVHGKRMNNEVVGMALAFKQGDYALAHHFCRRMQVKGSADKEENCLLSARREYLRCRANGRSHEEGISLLRLLFRKDVADRIEGEMGESQTIMTRLFPQMNCPDCEHCELAGKECDGPNALEVMDKIYAALSKSQVSQEDMLAYMKGLKG